MRSRGRWHPPAWTRQSVLDADGDHLPWYAEQVRLIVKCPSSTGTGTLRAANNILLSTFSMRLTIEHWHTIWVGDSSYFDEHTFLLFFSFLFLSLANCMEHFWLVVTFGCIYTCSNAFPRHLRRIPFGRLTTPQSTLPIPARGRSL